MVTLTISDEAANMLEEAMHGLNNLDYQNSELTSDEYDYKQKLHDEVLAAMGRELTNTSWMTGYIFVNGFPVPKNAGE